MFAAVPRAWSRLPTTTAPARTLRSHASPNTLVTVIPGDGVGPEIVQSAMGIVKKSGATVDFEVIEAKEKVIRSELTESISRTEVVLKGPLQSSKTHFSRNKRLRDAFQLNRNIVHVKSNPGIKTRHADIDIVIFRHNMEGEYTNMENEIVPGLVQSLKVTTASRTKILAEQAFEFAKQNGRKKVTAIHKANIQKLTDGLFIETIGEVAKNYPDIEYETMIVDNTSMQLVMNPNQFDVMLTPNLYGNIVTNIAVGLVGGPGLVPGANIGKRVAMFETGARHTGRDIAGQNVANPTAMILAAAKMLRHVKFEKEAATIEAAVEKVYANGTVLTKDVGGTASTTDFTAAVMAEM